MASTGTGGFDTAGHGGASGTSGATTGGTSGATTGGTSGATTGGTSGASTGGTSGATTGGALTGAGGESRGGAASSATGGASGSEGPDVGGSGGGGTASGGAEPGAGGMATGGAAGGGSGSGVGGAGEEGTPGRISGDGKCVPLCTSASLDPDGDGWGWENAASCIVEGTAADQGDPCEIPPEPGSGVVGGGACAALVNPKATEEARNLLCYLYDIYGKSVLSGQQETSWSNPAGDVQFYVDNVGKAPAVLGGDYLYPNGTTARAQAYWQAGGIPLIRYHMGAPPLADTYENSKGTANIDEVLTPASAANRSFEEKLDYVAAELAILQTAKVAVLWAPFHEYQPDGWFWWAKGTPAQFKELWIYMFDYLTKTKGLNNLVWLAPTSGTVDAAWYPGDQYVDLTGPDTYDLGQPFKRIFNDTLEVVGNKFRPIPLHETGRIVQPDEMMPNVAPWVLWNVWATYQSDGKYNTLDEIKRAYASPYTITRDEIPDLTDPGLF